MQNVVVYRTNKEDMEKVKEWYFSQYPYQGYDTRVTKERYLDDGVVEITFERMTSCD